MRTCSPRCACGLIILLSSSNKAAGEINGCGGSRGKKEPESVSVWGGREGGCGRERAADAQPLTEEGKERRGAKGREGGK